MLKHLLACAFTLASFFGSAQEIFDMPYATGTYLTGINDSGEICGYFTKSTGNTIGFWINKYGDTILLHGPGGSNTYCNATGINNKDMVVGNFGSASNVAAAQSFIYVPNPGRNNGGTYITVTNWGGINTQASGITDDTCISGSYQVGGNDCGAAWCNGEGTPTSLRCNNGGTIYPTYAYDINTVNHNTCGFIIEGAEEQAFVYRSSIDAWDTFQVGGFLKSRALGMNDNGWICGNYSSETKGFYAKKVWQQNLSNFQQIIVKGATTIYPSHINNNNDIVGFYYDAAGVAHGFIIATYDLGFRPSVNGFAFSNDTAFPRSYSNQFSYAFDPYLGPPDTFPKGTNGNTLSNRIFPPWPDFVNAFTEAECYDYINGHPVRHVQSYYVWAGVAGKYGGTCYGFGNNAAWLWDVQHWYTNRYPNAAAYSGLDVIDYPFSDTVQQSLYQTHVLQFSKEARANTHNHVNEKLSVYLQTVKQELRNSRGRPHYSQGIILQDSSGGHCVFPYKLVPGAGGNGIDTIYIYDCNFPFADTMYISVDLNDGTYGNWHYTAGGHLTHPPDWGNTPDGTGLFLNILDSIIKNPVHIRLGQQNDGPNYARSSTDTLLFASFNDSSTVQMTDDNDSVANFSSGRSTHTSLVEPFFIATGQVGQPTNAQSTSNITKVTKTGALSNDFLSIEGNTYLLRCDRLSGTDNSDNYQFSSGNLTYLNNGPNIKGVGFTIDQEDSNIEYNYYITGLNVPVGNKVAVVTSGNTGVTLQNFGPPTSYIITTEFLKPDSLETFRDTIQIQGNTQHTILPHDTTYSGIYILVDTGMTGNIEDSIFIHQTVTGINHINTPNITAWPVPSGNELFMSGPQGLISYTIVDVMGRTVATGEMDFANGTTQMFNIARFAPGVYTITGTGTQGKWNYMFVKQ